MNTWDNTRTTHNRTINTGPSPAGGFGELWITVGYTDAPTPDPMNKGIALDNHIIPLILRAPEMRDALRECLPQLLARLDNYELVGQPWRDLEALAEKVKALTGPTPQELYIQTGSYNA